MKVRYYLTAAGRSPVEKFIGSLPESTRLEVFDAISLLDSGRALEMPVSRNLSSIRPGLRELRFRDKAGQVRIIYFIEKRVAIYLVHGFRKKTQGIPRKELAVILNRLKEI
jgi:phage-related protein